MQAQGDGKLVSFSAAASSAPRSKRYGPPGASHQISQMFGADQKAGKDAIARYRPVTAEPVGPHVVQRS
jgi:hypothetical protein